MDALTPFASADAAALRRWGAQISPSSVYMRVDDNVRVTAYNGLASVVLNIRSRILSLDGTVQGSADVLTPTAARAASATVVVTDEGWLLGGEVFVSGAAPLVGQTYVVVEIVRGLGSSATPLQVIAAGYVTAKMPLVFPSSPIASSLQGVGALRSITGTNPGAGVEISETVPTGARWLLRGFTATLVTSAAAATRRVALLLDDGAATLLAVQATDAQAASLTKSYSGPNLGSYVVAQTTTLGLPFPAGTPLLAGSRIRTATTNLDVGDDWAAPQLLVEEFIEGA